CAPRLRRRVYFLTNSARSAKRTDCASLTSCRHKQVRHSPRFSKLSMANLSHPPSSTKHGQILNARSGSFGDTLSYATKCAAVAQAEERIATGISAIQLACGGRDAAELTAEDFPTARNPQTCTGCPYRKICWN